MCALLLLLLVVLCVDGFFVGKQGRYGGRRHVLGARSKAKGNRKVLGKSALEQVLNQLSDIRNITAANSASLTELQITTAANSASLTELQITTAANFARVDASLAELQNVTSANFARVDASLTEMQITTAANFARVDSTIAANFARVDSTIAANFARARADTKLLIDYNQNRDKELEDLITDVYMGALLKEKWVVEKIKVGVIFSPYGTRIMEWDGILFGTHPDFVPTFFFVEAKQVATSAKYQKLVTNVADMTSIYLPAILKHSDNPSENDDENYKEFVNKLLKHLIPNKNLYHVAGVLGSPGMEPSLREKMLSENKVGFVHLSQEQYQSNIRGLRSCNQTKPDLNSQQHKLKRE